MQPDEEERDGAVREAAPSAEDLAALLVAQLDALRASLRETSTLELADALEDLRSRVAALLDEDTEPLGPTGDRSLRAIAAATARIDDARLRLLDDVAAPASAETALRRWTGSVPGDERVRPTGGV